MSYQMPKYDIWFQVIQSNTNIFQTSIWPMDGTLTGTTSPGQSEPGSNDNLTVTSQCLEV